MLPIDTIFLKINERNKNRECLQPVWLTAWRMFKYYVGREAREYVIIWYYVDKYLPIYLFSQKWVWVWGFKKVNGKLDNCERSEPNNSFLPLFISPTGIWIVLLVTKLRNHEKKHFLYLYNSICDIVGKGIEKIEIIQHHTLILIK